MGKSLTVVGRSPPVTAEKTGGIVLAALNGRICAVDLLQEHSGCNRQELLRPRRLVTEDRQRRAWTSNQTCAGALARHNRGVFVARLRFAASKILATAPHGGSRHRLQAD